MWNDTNGGVVMPIKGFTCNLRVILAEEKTRNPAFTQKRLAEKIGLSRTALNALVNENTLPSFETAYAIATELNRPIERIWVKFDNRVEDQENDSV
ncbi:helix-turn-helix transcriptional regulator [Sutcliffiella sp. FSL R7-0096]|uniref:helix-turn-helix transcriptional regulator n=1 Tax=Sutcliffiella sp. FSL R7-0096 TaxID=2921670 RepID=UPI00315AEFF3